MTRVVGGGFAEAARRDKTPVAVLDLGGTRFRAAVLDVNDEIVGLREVPAIGRRTRQDPMPVLQKDMVSYVIATASSLTAMASTRLVGVSIGAAVNHITGRVIGSAPLWGSSRCNFDLGAELRQARPDLSWTVLNDVTALATALLVELPRTTSGLAAAMTVSSGIAYRTIDLGTGEIPVDPTHGLQGEIGHLPAEMFWRGRRLNGRCDCGRERHVSSFSSGPGIVRMLRDTPDLAALVRDWTDSHSAAGAENLVLTAFAERVQAGDRTARTLLDTVTRPIAQILLYQATLSPQLTGTVVSGGVVAAFGPDYLRSILTNLSAMQLYAISTIEPHYFADRIALGREDGLSALRGAGFRARGSTTLRGQTPW